LAPSAALPAFTTPSATLSSTRLFSSTPATFREKKDKSWVQQGEVPYPELKSHTETPDESLLLLDVREPSETAQGMIPSAVNVPLSEFGPAFLNKEGGGDFEKKYAFARPEFDKKIVVYCRSGKRSEQARTELEKAGWWNVRNYTGSWLDWTAQEKQRG
ncbi:Rhodanese-like protein, partial [Microstroma glucosiphilum]